MRHANRGRPSCRAPPPLERERACLGIAPAVPDCLSVAVHERSERISMSCPGAAKASEVGSEFGEGSDQDTLELHGIVIACSWFAMLQQDATRICEGVHCCVGNSYT